MNCRLADKTDFRYGKKAILFDVDDTLYDQTVPFKEAYAEYFGEKPAVPAEHNLSSHKEIQRQRVLSGYDRSDHNGRYVYLQSTEGI